MFDFNQLMQMASLASSLGGGAAGAAGQAVPQAPVAQAPVPTTPVPQMPVPVEQGGQVPQMGGFVAQAPAGQPAPQSAPPQMPVAGAQGGQGSPMGGQPIPQPMAGVTAPETAPQAQKTGFDRFTEWLGGGMTGDTPEAVADRDNFRKMNTLMALGTSLGGAIAGGPGASVVGDVSSALNKYAQGNIMASNAAEKEGSMNQIMNKQLDAITGGAPQSQAGAQGGAQTGAPQAGAGGDRSVEGIGASALSNAPVQAPTAMSSISAGGSTMTVADLESRLMKAFG